MRKVFLDDLPRWDKGTYKGKTKWQDSLNCNMRFDYEGLKGTLKIVDYKYPFIWVKYKNKEPSKIGISNLIKGRIGGVLRRKTEEFRYEMGHIIKDDKRDIIIIDREIRNLDRKDGLKENQKWYKYHCNKDEYEGWTIENTLLKGHSCACCTNQVVVEGYNDIPTTAPFMIPFFQGGYDEAKLYTKSSGKKIYPICPNCKKIKKKPMGINHIYNRHSIVCTCSDKISYPNKFSYSLLNQLNEIYNFDYLEHEYNPDWIGQKRYDNYFKINNKEYILEMDGSFHKKDNNMSGQTKEESKAIDDEKDKLAKEHGIKVIRIDCDKSDIEYIKQNIINSKLNEIFDLTKIDWLKCEEFALSNLVKIACSYWNGGIESTLEISKIMKLSRPTVINYLKKGNY